MKKILLVLLLAPLLASAQNQSIFGGTNNTPSYNFPSDGYGGGMGMGGFGATGGSVNLSNVGSCSQGSTNNSPKIEAGVGVSPWTSKGIATDYQMNATPFGGNGNTSSVFAKVTIPLERDKLQNVDCSRIQAELERLAQEEVKTKVMILENARHEAELKKQTFENSKKEQQLKSLVLEAQIQELKSKSIKERATYNLPSSSPETPSATPGFNLNLLK